MITVAIVEDDPPIREGLRTLMAGSERVRCSAAFGSAEEALEPGAIDGVDIVLINISLPGIDGIECVRLMQARYPTLLTMMLTTFDDDARLFRALEAGATGYLLKTIQPDKLLEAITELHGGGSPMSGGIARRVVERFRSEPVDAPEVSSLSPREREILDHLGGGYRYKEIADLLFISIDTVRTHIRNIYEKLHVQSRTEALLKLRPNR